MADSILAAVDPEMGVPMMIGKQLAPHAPTLLMVPLVGFAILLIIVGIIVLSAAKNKMPGTLLTMLGFLMAGGAFFVMYRNSAAVAAK